MKKEPTIQRSIAWPSNVYKAIKRQAKRRKTHIAAYIRFAVEQQLTADGEDVSTDLMWGGARYSENEEEAVKA